jgi:hypothetical protein
MSQTQKGTNPKDLLGAKKVSITKLPAVAILHGAHAMMNGAEKYGPYNWRGNAVIASIYIDAAMRHLLAYFEGEQEAPDSGVHHLGHVIACAAILLDAETTRNLVDDRPLKDYVGAASIVLDDLNKKIKERQSSTRTQAPSKGDAPPDQNCNTLPNGDCIGTNCMHSEGDPVVLVTNR